MPFTGQQFHLPDPLDVLTQARVASAEGTKVNSLVKRPGSSHQTTASGIPETRFSLTLPEPVGVYPHSF